MNVQEKTDVDDGNTVFLISNQMFSVPGRSSPSINNSNNNNSVYIVDETEPGVDACPTEAQCRCHLSYSCDYRTVDVRWKSLTPKNNNKNCVCPPTNCCHWHCWCSHERLLPLLPPSTSPFLERVAIYRRRRRLSLPYPSTSFPLPFLSTTIDEVEVDNTCMIKECQQCISLKEKKSVLNFICDLSWRCRSGMFNLGSQDFKMTTTPVWKWEFTSKIQRFMTRFSGRRRRPQRWALNSFAGYPWARMTSFLYVIFAVFTGCLHLRIADACSSRSTPKPRPPSPTLRPNITIQTYTCPPEYDAHYCLNGAKCFTVKIGQSILYNCECADGYMGQRCEFKDLDGSYLPSKQRGMLEQAGITSGVAITIVFVIIVCFYLYVRSRRKYDSRRSNGHDEVDTFVAQPRRPFSGLHSPTAAVQQHQITSPSTFPVSGNEPRMTNDSLPTPKTASSPIKTFTTDAGTKSTVLLKDIVPNNQSRLCV